jgi:hypothetical protein
MRTPLVVVLLLSGCGASLEARVRAVAATAVDERLDLVLTCSADAVMLEAYDPLVGGRRSSWGKRPTTAGRYFVAWCDGCTRQLLVVCDGACQPIAHNLDDHVVECWP